MVHRVAINDTTFGNRKLGTFFGAPVFIFTKSFFLIKTNRESYKNPEKIREELKKTKIKDLD